MHSASLMNIFTGNCFPCSYLSNDKVWRGSWTKPWMDVLPADGLIPGCFGSCWWTCPALLFSGEARGRAVQSQWDMCPQFCPSTALAPRWPVPGASENQSEFLLLERLGR